MQLEGSGAGLVSVVFSRYLYFHAQDYPQILWILIIEHLQYKFKIVLFLKELLKNNWVCERWGVNW
jgi:hypothetical protein